MTATNDLTIVISVHNYAKFLGMALASIRQQHREAAIIVIDDASDDDPRTVVQRLQMFGESIEFHRTEFRNIYQVRRFALTLVRTRQVLFLNADKVLHPDYLKHLPDAPTSEPSPVSLASPSIWPVRTNAFAGRCSVITSLSPNPQRLVRQLHCLQSWIDYGLPVITLNTPDELAGMYLPRGVVACPSSDLATIYDRQTQRISAMINVGIETGLPFMLLNSDIEISGHTDVLNEALQHCDNLTIGVRYNCEGGREPTREPDGLDCFLMTPDLARTIPPMPFGIGKPFWDYWLPFHFKNLGVHFHWIKSPFFFHVSHTVYWSSDEWLRGCMAVRDQYGVDLSNSSGEFRKSLDNW
jgi:glycosyltransferase involved in cell wall biosynthesis